MKKILIVAAHPDDEVLGCGGTMARHSDNGDEVHVVFMSDGVSSRQKDFEDELKLRKKAAFDSCQLLGAKPPYFFGFPDNKMDTIALLEIVKKLEKLISKIKPTVIYTHYNNDLNIDHKITHQAVLTACRPEPNNHVNEIYCFEVLSSTEWSSSGDDIFHPNFFINITSFLDLKVKALNFYSSEMKDYPHTRSIQNVQSLANYRGSTTGMIAAESFKIERVLVK